MMNRELSYALLGTVFSVSVVLLFNYSTHPLYSVIWASSLAAAYAKKMNHFVNLLLVLELLAIMNLWLLATNFSGSGASFIFILALITVIVGGAGLGLGLLVKFVRLSTSELVIASNL